MADGTAQADGQHDLGNGRKHILLNAFDMSTIGHLSPGQWKVSTCISQAQQVVRYLHLYLTWM